MKANQKRAGQGLNRRLAVGGARLFIIHRHSCFATSHRLVGGSSSACAAAAQRVRQRILDYNEDDWRATRVLLDGIRGLAA
jgi:hypothetical protein